MSMDVKTSFLTYYIRSLPERWWADEISKTKTEAEFGIDAAFVSRDGKLLTIFVLKDEPLNNSTWTQNDFDADLRRAAVPDLEASGFKSISVVRVILVYNTPDSRTKPARGVVLQATCSR